MLVCSTLSDEIVLAEVSCVVFQFFCSFHCFVHSFQFHYRVVPPLSTWTWINAWRSVKLDGYQRKVFCCVTFNGNAIRNTETWLCLYVQHAPTSFSRRTIKCSLSLYPFSLFFHCEHCEFYTRLVCKLNCVSERVVVCACPVKQINIRTYISVTVMFVCTAHCMQLTHLHISSNVKISKCIICWDMPSIHSRMNCCCCCCCLPLLSVCVCFCAFFLGNCVTNYHYLLAIVPLSQLQLPQVIFNPKWT